jgi:hypothetical protein
LIRDDGRGIERLTGDDACGTVHTCNDKSLTEEGHVAELDTINRDRETSGRATGSASTDLGQTTDPAREVVPSPTALARLDAALDICEPTGRTRLLPVHHWAFVAPPCPTGSRIRMRFVRSVPVGEKMAVVVRPDDLDGGRVHEVRVGSTVAVSTTLLDPTAHPGQVWISPMAWPLRGPDVDAPTVLKILSAAPVDVANRSAMVLLLTAAHSAGRPPLLGVHVDFHTPITDLDDLCIDLTVTPDGRGSFAVGRADEPAQVSGTLWFGCGPHR